MALGIDKSLEVISDVKVIVVQSCEVAAVAKGLLKSGSFSWLSLLNLGPVLQVIAQVKDLSEKVKELGVDAVGALPEIKDISVDEGVLLGEAAVKAIKEIVPAVVGLVK